MSTSIINYYSDALFVKNFFFTVVIFFTSLIISYVISFFLIALGLTHKLTHRFLHVFVSLVQPIPRVVLFPFLLLIFGINDFSKIALVVLGLVFSNFLILDAQVHYLKDGALKKIIQVYVRNQFSIYYYYYFKGSFDTFISTFKNSIGYGLTLTIISESSYSNQGLGYLIWRHWERYEMLELSLVVVSISVLSILIHQALGTLQKYYQKS